MDTLLVSHVFAIGYFIFVPVYHNNFTSTNGGFIAAQHLFNKQYGFLCINLNHSS